MGWRGRTSHRNSKVPASAFGAWTPADWPHALIRLDAGLKTDPLFAGLPDDRCQCAHWGYIISGTMRVHSADGSRDYAAGETYYWEPGHNLEAVTDAEYIEITRSDEYDALMAHCKRVMAG